MINAEEFFIEHERQNYGPYDLMSMIRKIRSGQITAHTVVFSGGEETGRHASDIPVFYEVFMELAREANEESYDGAAPLTLVGLLKGALETFSLNLILSLYTGTLLLLIIGLCLAIYVLTGGILVTALVGGIAGCFLFALYQMAILRKTRMQLVGLGFFIGIIKRCGLALLLVSVITGVFVFAVPIILTEAVGPVALALILLPGSFIMLAALFAPMLAVDRGMGGIEALRGSCAALRTLGRDNIITLYLLLLMNFIGAAFLLVPLLMSLPLTIAALCEVYDEHLNQFKIS